MRAISLPMFLSTALLIGLPAQAAPDQEMRLAALFPEIGPNASLTAEVREGASVMLLGLITPTSTDGVRKILDTKTTINTLYIDSQGGDVPAAMTLADMVRQRKLRVVVAGRCLSACANYVFAASTQKSVLPGSLVGIHGKSLQAYKDGMEMTVDARDQDRLIAMTGEPALAGKIAAIDQRERHFYVRHGISTRYHDAFERYALRRATHVAPASACPAIDFWVLRSKDLKNMGVSGIVSMWEPADQAAASKAAANLGLGNNAVFFGDVAALDARCRQPSSFMAWLRGLFG